MPANEGDAEVGLVLLHGSELGSWIWDRVVGVVGRRALAVDLPGRDGAPEARRRLRLADAVDSVAEDIATLDGRPVVLVAHSFSGVLVPGLIDQVGSQVRAVVWLAATVPEVGKSWVDLLPTPQRQILRVLYRLRPAGMLSPRKESLALLCNDLDDATAATVVDRRVPEAPGFLLDRVRSPVPDALPSHYVHLLDDLAQSEAARTAAIARLSAPRVHELPGGHLPMLSRPHELAALLDQIAATHEREPFERP
jgi:pimeloyl-ACP methyl ester carboxylesterase